MQQCQFNCKDFLIEDKLIYSLYIRNNAEKGMFAGMGEICPT